MEVYQIQSVEVSIPAACEEEKQRWVEEYACRLQDLFEQWQKPLPSSYFIVFPSLLLELS
jgi:hypothetical protein